MTAVGSFKHQTKSHDMLGWSFWSNHTGAGWTNPVFLNIAFISFCSVRFRSMHWISVAPSHHGKLQSSTSVSNRIARSRSAWPHTCAQVDQETRGIGEQDPSLQEEEWLSACKWWPRFVIVFHLSIKSLVSHFSYKIYSGTEEWSMVVMVAEIRKEIELQSWMCCSDAELIQCQ